MDYLNYLAATRQQRRSEATFEESVRLARAANKILELPGREGAALLYYIDAYDLLTAAMQGDAIRTQRGMQKMYEFETQVRIPTELGGKAEFLKNQLAGIIKKYSYERNVELPTGDIEQEILIAMLGHVGYVEALLKVLPQNGEAEARELAGTRQRA